MNEYSPSLRSAYLWTSHYEQSNGDIRSLTDALDRCGMTGRFGQKGNELIDGAIWDVYMQAERPSVQDAVDEAVVRINNENRLRSLNATPEQPIRLPSYGCVYHRINNLSGYEALRSRYGAKRSQQEYQWVQEPVRATRPGEVWEFDVTPGDLLLIDAELGYIIGRAYITAGYDRFTGMATGIHIGLEPPGHRAVMECLLHSILPKDYLARKYPFIKGQWPVCGLPEMIAIDGGREFRNKHLYHACAQVGIGIMELPPRAPKHKGGVENFLKRLNYSLLQKIPGTTFGNVYARGDYDPAKHAILDIHDLYAILHVYIVDRLSKRHNRRLKAAPVDLWTRGAKEYPLALPGSVEELHILLLGTEYRVPTRQGIELFHLFYNSKRLALMRAGLRADRLDRPVAVKYDTWDLSHVWVYDASAGSWIDVPALDREYTANLTLYRHQANIEYLNAQKRAIDIVALAEAGRLIARMVKDAYSRTRRAKTRKKLAMLQPGYRPTTARDEGPPLTSHWSLPRREDDDAGAIQALISTPFEEPTEASPAGDIYIKGTRLKPPAPLAADTGSFATTTPALADAPRRPARKPAEGPGEDMLIGSIVRNEERE